MWNREWNKQHWSFVNEVPELRRVGRPFVVVLEKENILPVHVIQALNIGLFPFFFHQFVQQLHWFGSLEALRSEPIALRAYLLHAIQKLHRNPMVHQLQAH